VTIAPAPPALMVSADAAATKGRVGATAWLVLEHLALCASPSEGAHLEVVATARSVGRALSVSKDTAATALRRLGAEGVVQRLPQARSAGRYGCGVYRVHLPAGLARIEGPVGDRRPPPPPPPPPRRATPPPSSSTPDARPEHRQLNLFDGPEAHRP
jgi:hypothetical protein